MYFFFCLPIKIYKGTNSQRRIQPRSRQGRVLKLQYQCHKQNCWQCYQQQAQTHTHFHMKDMANKTWPSQHCQVSAHAHTAPQQLLLRRFATLQPFTPLASFPEIEPVAAKRFWLIYLWLLVDYSWSRICAKLRILLATQNTKKPHTHTHHTTIDVVVFSVQLVHNKIVDWEKRFLLNLIENQTDSERMTVHLFDKKKVI